MEIFRFITSDEEFDEVYARFKEIKHALYWSAEDLELQCLQFLLNKFIDTNPVICSAGDYSHKSERISYFLEQTGWLGQIDYSSLKKLKVLYEIISNDIRMRAEWKEFGTPESKVYNEVKRFLESKSFEFNKDFVLSCSFFNEAITDSSRKERYYHFRIHYLHDHWGGELLHVLAVKDSKFYYVTQLGINKFRYQEIASSDIAWLHDSEDYGRERTELYEEVRNLLERDSFKFNIDFKLAYEGRGLMSSSTNEMCYRVRIEYLHKHKWLSAGPFGAIAIHDGKLYKIVEFYEDYLGYPELDRCEYQEIASSDIWKLLEY